MTRAMIIACLAALTATTASAEPANDAASGPVARIPLMAAITAAEQHVRGQAVRAEYEAGKDGRWVYDIEVKAGAKVFDVKVDADKGTVIAAQEDRQDAEDEEKAD